MCAGLQIASAPVVPSPFLCTRCTQTHLSTPTKNLLRLLPLSLYHTTEIQVKVQRKVEGVEAGQAVLLSNLKSMDQCIDEACEVGEITKIAEREKIWKVLFRGL